MNDADCFVANFWRSVRAAPEEVARWADWPVNEADLVARRRWLQANAGALRVAVMADPDHFDAKVAGWWLWGRCASIGDSWTLLRPEVETNLHLPVLSCHGIGVHSLSMRGRVREVLEAIAARLRHVRVTCGDWRRCLSPTATWKFNRSRNGVATGVFLDPPYRGTLALYDSFGEDATRVRRRGHPTNAEVAARRDLSAEARAWALENGSNPLLRIVLCGAFDEHAELGWPSHRVGNDEVWSNA